MEKNSTKCKKIFERLRKHLCELFSKFFEKGMVKYWNVCNQYGVNHVNVEENRYLY